MSRRRLLVVVLASLLLGCALTALAPVAAQNVLTNADVIKMAKAGLSDEVIINTIGQYIAAFDLSPDGVIELKKGGVSDGVVAAMQKRAGGSSSGAARPAPAKPAASELSIPDATEVKVRLIKTMTSATARVDDEVKFEVVDPVVVDGVTVVQKDAIAQGVVLLAESRKSFGRKGKLDFSIDTVEAIDGQKIRLRYSREMRGNSKYGTAGVVTFLTGPFGFFVKGKDVEIPAGTEYTIYIDGERKIKLGS